MTACIRWHFHLNPKQEDNAMVRVKSIGNFIRQIKVLSSNQGNKHNTELPAAQCQLNVNIQRIFYGSR